MNSRSSSIREMIVDRCLRSKSHFTLKEIMEAVNTELSLRGETLVTSKHTVLQDIYGIADRWKINLNIEKKGRYTYYSYEDPSFTIYNTSLKEEEILNLTTTLMMLKRFQGLPNFDWVQKLIDNGKNVLGTKVIDEEVVGLEENPYVQGLHHLSPLHEAIVHKTVIDIWYHPFGAEEAQKHTVHPYYLKQYNTRWFLLGSNDHYRSISNFPLDRIEKVEINQKVLYLENDICDFHEYFEDMVGVSKPKNAEIENVLIWVSPGQWPYTETKPLHGSQKVIERREDGSVIVQLNVCLNWELEQLVLLHGEGMKVLAPVAFRERIKGRIGEALKMYKVDE